MPLSFPIAHDARAALDADAEAGARTLAEARELARGPVKLVSDWLRPDVSEQEIVQRKAEVGVARGFVQLYEDMRGQPVVSVTYWKPQNAAADKKAAKGKKTATPDVIAVETKPAALVADHTDDLYFAKASSRTKKRKRANDPNQMDLFTGPDQRGAETPDPGNPSVVIVDEEGDGAAFGRTVEDAPDDVG